MDIKFNITPYKLTISWDLVRNDTLNVDQEYNVLLNTSNCGTCPTTTTPNFAVCNLIQSNEQLDLCTILVIIQDNFECDITKNATVELNLTSEGQKYNIISNTLLG